MRIMKIIVVSVLFCALFLAPVQAAPARKAPKPKPAPAAKAVKKAPPPAAIAAAAKDKKFSFGYGAGAARFEFGKKFFDLGFGIGKNYALLDLRLRADINMNNIVIVQPSIDAAYYSEKVRNIPGISGTLSKGGQLGLGISFGKEFGKYEWSLGYSSILGLTLMGSYNY